MKNLRMYFAASVVVSPSIFLLFYMAVPVLAEDLQGLRLFHEPVQSGVKDLQLSIDPGVRSSLPENSNARLTAKKQAKPRKKTIPQSAELAASTSELPVANDAYRYNGFISTGSGRHYLVNGLPLGDLYALKLVSAKLGGRSIVLKTLEGQVFELSVGQSISKKSL